MRKLITAVLLAGSTLSISTLALAQGTAPERKGFWFNIGMGTGSLGCDDCGTRETGLSGGLALGGTINSRLLLGGATNGWTKSEDGVTLTMGSVTAAVRFYPSATGRFFLLAGLGVATLDLGVSGSGQHPKRALPPCLGWATTSDSART